MTGIVVWLFLAGGKWQSGLPEVRRCRPGTQRTHVHVTYPQTQLVRAHFSGAQIKKCPESGQSLKADSTAKENAPYEMESLKSFTVCQKRLTKKKTPKYGQCWVYTP